MKKAYISADIEGMEGALTGLTVSRGGMDFSIARRRLALDVNAAIRACFDSGYDEVVVCDGHADMENLIPEDMDVRAKLISGSMRDSLQMQDIENGYDIYISFGHAGAGLNIDGVLNHCYNGGKIYNMRFNGVTMNTETVVNGAFAGYYNVPLIAVIGDEAVCREVREFVPNVEGIAVKKGFGRHSAISVHPDKAREMIYTGVKNAIKRKEEIKPISVIGEEVTFEIDFKETSMADTACLIPGVVRTAPRSISYKGKATDVFKLHELIVYRVVDSNKF
ncbi:MAG: M55 family metallopeptidase [Clostridiales bacterium]|jgi:D-amino peptidase|nr:M55 family metallopeptidase [Clostridiales bacterium]